jgi:DNA-binding beta-propeller fold protein YncE
MSTAVAVLFVLLVCAASAAATPGHRYSGQFGSAGPGNGQFSGPSGVAVDQSTGDVFVGDEFNGLVQKFNGSGDFQVQWSGSATPATFFSLPAQVAADGSGSSVYVADQFNNAIDRFDAGGVYQGQLDASATAAGAFSDPQGVAVDPTNGDVYVADTSNGVIDHFDSAGVLQGEFGAGELAFPTQLAVDANHNVYVVDSGNARVVEYSGETLGATIDTDSPTTVAVDPASGEVFVGEFDFNGYQIAEYAGDGTKLSTFGAGKIEGAGGIGVNSTTGRVYVSDQFKNVVSTFSAITLPAVTTTPGATAITPNNATVAGTVNPEGVPGATTYRFEYGPDTTYGNSSPEIDTGGGSAAVPASAELSGLQPGTTYHFRLVATNGQGSNVGTDQTFTTPAAAATVGGQPAFASAITPAGATLNGTVNPNGADTTYHFEYGTTSGYGTSTPAGDAGGITGETPVSAPITGLQPGTTYHFRVVASNGIGTAAEGADQTFTTAPAPPVSATDVGAVIATIQGTINPQGQLSTYRFEYGTDTSYGTSTPERTGGTGSSDEVVSSNITGLQPATTYHARLVVTIGGQTVSSEDATFTTAPAPALTIAAPTAVGAHAATFHGTIDTGGVRGGTYGFVVTSTTPSAPYSRATDATAIPAGGGAVAASADLSDLPAGATYVVRLDATAGGTTTFGPTTTFATGPEPPLVSSPSIASSQPQQPAAAPPAPPANKATAKAKTSGTRATLTITVPGAGTLKVSGSGLIAASKTAKAKGQIQVTVSLNSASKSALKKTKSKKLSRTAAVTFTPTGGTAGTTKVHLTFKRG